LHLAGDTTPGRSASDINLELQCNLIPLLHLLEAINDTPVARVVLLSSGGTVYGRPQYTPIDENHPTAPTTPYGLGKLTAEHVTRLWATQHSRECVLLRAANPYGPYQFGRNNQGVIGVWLQNILDNEPLVVWGDGTTIRDYVYVGDLAQAISIACTQAFLQSGIYNLGSGRGHSLLQIAELIAEVTATRPELTFTPVKPYDVLTNVLSPSRYQDATGWRPSVTLRDGIRATHEFLVRYRTTPRR
jgi:UDP-glucose 4-epimerase